ncbi:hypothetical protein BKA58DRAFT_99360 [Alternaria rosae]|uniref:uncharacterized protein n=1 Tax=Alternaria rosae TaxID=1187941 RepID=UPI001E8DF838|nr:uncharacterized protein BKA58DRAFT_99360 [Alternaria rosae]KAH6878642.1 hypothetical protein BKA58DRAFT_99360 [Alternaria rosae]
MHDSHNLHDCAYLCDKTCVNSTNHTLERGTKVTHRPTPWILQHTTMTLAQNPRGRARGGRGGRGDIGGAGIGCGAPNIANAPTGPASMRQAGQQYGSGAPPVAPRGGHPGGGFRGAHEHGHGHGHGSSGGDGERTGPANELSKKATIALDIKRFFQPWGAFSDQATLEGYGVRKRYPKCMRCGAVKLKDHPDFKDCMGRCDCCGSSMAHIGEMCSQTWASMKWHMEHNGWLPDDVQFRPTPEQCAEFAKVDPYFGRIVPLQEIIQAPAG